MGSAKALVIACCIACCGYTPSLWAAEEGTSAGEGTIFTLWPLVDYRESPHEHYRNLSLLGPLFKFQVHGDDSTFAARGRPSSTSPACRWSTREWPPNTPRRRSRAPRAFRTRKRAPRKSASMPSPTGGESSKKKEKKRKSERGRADGNASPSPSAPE